ncbi:Alpha/Beta hydrolase protein [Hyaloraphidium curvatum]|nr:Alpha/Beta hydrolase protein [Hyaloraphidium curvatum]
MSKLVFDDKEMDGQLGRTLIGANSASADIGEAMATALRVVPGPDSYGSWFKEWSALAARCEDRARAALAAGHKTTARQCFLRATEYWRQAIFFVRGDLDDPRLQEGYARHRAAFRAAIPLFEDCTITATSIPYASPDGKIRTELSAYHFVPAGGPKTDRPLVIAPCGYDSTAEAGYSLTAYMCLKHGYDCVTFDGPGQGSTLYLSRIPMDTDFETVLPAVVSWSIALPGVDPKRIAVFGRSFAGYLAPRGVAGDDRVAALMCDPGQYEFVSRVVGKMFDQATWDAVLAGDPAVEARLQKLLEDPHRKEYFGARMATLGAKTVAEFLRLQVKQTVEPVVSKIRCPVLLMEGQGDFAGQSPALYAALDTDKTLIKFPVEEGAGGHCGGLGATLIEEAAFNWLDEKLAAKAK